MRQLPKLAIVINLAFLASCAGTPDKPPIEQALVQDLVTQVRLALSAVAKRYNSDDSDLPLSLELTNAQVKVSTALQLVEGRSAKLVVISGGNTQTDTSENYILLTLTAPKVDKRNFAISPIASNFLDEEASEYFIASFDTINQMEFAIASETDLLCGKNSGKSIFAGSEETEFWEDVAALTSAAADGYLCAALASDTLPVDLESLEVNVAFTLKDKGEAGIKFEIWKLELGRSGSAEVKAGNSIKMTFSTTGGDN